MSLIWMHLQVDTELVYAYAKTGGIGPLEEFISGSHQANLQSVGDRCFTEGLFEAARIIFQHIPNWGRLASTLVKLHLFQQAVDAARKANSPRTWKEVKLLHFPRTLEIFQGEYHNCKLYVPVMLFSTSNMHYLGSEQIVYSSM